MQVFFGIAYFIMGIVQLFAIIEGIAFALNIGKFLSGIIAFLITYIPLVGSAVGVYGAVNVWHWSLLQAGALFFWYVPVFIFLAVFGAFSNR